MKENIFKGILLWITVFSTLLFIIAIDNLSLVSSVVWLSINVALIMISYVSLTIRDVYYLSGSKFIDKILK